MRWEDVIDVAEKWADDCRDLSMAMRIKAASVYTRKPGGYYYHPAGAVALYGMDGDDFLRCKTAAVRVVGRDHVIPVQLDGDDVSSGAWIKIAYSPALRRTGELLNFFPGTYPGGIPNAPSPLAALLTTALVGGGLGYGLGALGEEITPKGYGKHFKRTGALVGAGLGGVAASPWLLANSLDGRRLNDPSLLSAEAGSEPASDPAALALPTHADTKQHNDFDLGILSDLYDPKKSNKHAADILARIPLGLRYKQAVDHFVKRAWGTFGVADTRRETAYDVNVNSLGQTLWETGASPSLAATTMGAMYAAQQMPDPESRPGFATGHQLGQLAMNAGKDYAKGLVFGAVINKTLGTPYTAPQMGMASVGLGIIQTAVSGLLN